MRTAFRRHLFTPALLRYLAVGGFGFAVDAGGLETLNRGFGMEVHAARCCSMALAIACTYLLHRHFTFTDSRKPARTAVQFAAFSAVQMATALLNFGIFTAVLWLLPRPLPLLPAVIEPDAANLFSLGCGVAAGLCANWAILRLVVFPATEKGGNGP